MAQRFNLTAQLQLQAPTNTQQVINQIRTQLQGVSVNVDVQANARAVTQVNQSLQNTTRQANNAARSVGVLNRNLSEAARRFGVITLATGTMLSFAQAVKRAVGEAIEFERELIKIAQTTGKTVEQLSSLTQEVTRLSTSLGVSSSSLLETARVLAQAGFSADDTRKALDILAKTTLGSSFDDITKTVEGAIAVLRQFRSEALAAGGDIKFLEQSLDAINSVSKAFAVESSDLIAVIQRVGGVFASAGGSVNELIALFTSVRATTRESAETIATGLRTIFTRIQRTETVNQLEQLGISLRDAEGKFVGAFEAVRRLSLGLSALDPRDYRFSEIVEELGGFRQIGKVIPLIQQFTTAQDALNVAQGASGSVTQDAIIAQQSLAVQAQKVREEFAALIRQLADSSTFRSIASGALQLAKALISIGEALEPVLPLLTSLLALKIGQGLAPGIGALLGFGGRRRYGGGVIRKFARGGFVPGTGNSDTVPAMLTPGEFVIRKSSAEKLGSDTLQSMNKYAEGGVVNINRHGYGKLAQNSAPMIRAKREYNEQQQSPNAWKRLSSDEQQELAARFANKKTLRQAEGLSRDRNKLLNKYPGGYFQTRPNAIGGFFLTPESGSDRGYKLTKDREFKLNNQNAAIAAGSTISNFLPFRQDLKKNSRINRIVDANAKRGIKTGVINSSSMIGNLIGGAIDINEQKIEKAASKVSNDKQVFSTLGGYMYEGIIQGLTGAQLKGGQTSFDYPKITNQNKIGLATFFGQSDAQLSGLIKADAKRSLNSSSNLGIFDKIINSITQGDMRGVKKLRDIKTNKVGRSRQSQIDRETKKYTGGLIQKFASGGDVGTDTVPALLTPGEFVINKESAQKIGYGNLRSMNRDGVSRFASGGPVGVQKFANGGMTMGAPGSLPFMGRDADSQRLLANFNQAQAQLNQSTKSLSQQFKDAALKWSGLSVVVGTLQKSGQAANSALNKIGQSQIPVLSGAARNLQSTGATAGQAFGTSEGRQAFGGRLDSIAGAAQQFAFLGGVAASLAGQFSGLSEQTSSAITETAGFVTSIVGVGGTVVQMFTSLFSSGTNQVAGSLASAAADQAQATSSSAAATAGASMATTFGLIAIAVVAAVAAIKFFAAQAEANAKKFDELAGKEIEAIKGGIGDDSGARLAELQSQAISSRTEASAYNQSMVSGEAIGGALGGAAVGAVVGSAVPIIGTAIGAAIGAGFGYFGGAMLDYTDSIEEAQAAQQALSDKVRNSSDALISSIRSQREFDQALSDISAANLAPEEAVTRRVQAQGATAGVDFSNAQSAADTLNQLAIKYGKSVAELSEADFAGSAAELTLFKNATQTAAVASDNMAKRVNETRKTLQDAASLELTGDVDIGQLLADPTSKLSQALLQSEAAIIQEARSKISALEAQYRTTDSIEEHRSITQQINAEQQRTNQRIKDQRDALAAQNEEIRKNKEELANSTAAQEAYRQSLMRINEFTNSLVAAEAQLNQFEDDLNAMTALREGKGLDFSTRAPAGLEDLSQVGDRNIFEQQVDAIAANLGPEGQRLAGIVKQTSALIDDANTNLIGVKFDPTGDLPTAEEVLDRFGITEADLGPAFQKFKSDFTEAIKDGTLSQEEFDSIFGPIIQNGEAAAEALKRGNDLQNKQLDIYGKYIDELQAKANEEIAARQSIIDTQMKGAEFRAQARGGELSPAQRAGFATQKAQTALSGVTDTTGRQLQAGNLAQIAATKAAAKAEREKIAQLKQSTNFDRLSADQKLQLIERDKELIDVIGKTSDEIKRMSEETVEVEAALAAVSGAAQRRETLKGVVEEFVVGGDQERKSINEALAGIESAVATGTLQNQTDEQRKATVEMLDRLGDITIPGTGGMSAEQVKQEVIFRDAVRMGLAPEIAKQLATQTTEEERLIQALDRLTVVMEQAAVAAGNAKGGLVYRALGGPIFRPKGTDTVPAMLTPGEFVLRKSAVDKIGVGPLTSLNNGNSNVVYRQFGGPITSQPQKDFRGMQTASGAMFTGQTPDINIATPEMFKRAFTEDLANMKQSELLKYIVKNYSDTDVIKAARRLYAMGELDPKRLDIERMIKPYEMLLSNMIANIDMFEEAGGRGITIRAPNPDENLYDFNSSTNDYFSRLENIFAAGQGQFLDFKQYSIPPGKNTSGMIELLKNFGDKTTTYANNIASMAGPSLTRKIQQSSDPQARDKLFVTLRELQNSQQGDIEKNILNVGERSTIKFSRSEQRKRDLKSNDIQTLRNAGIFFNKGGMVPDTVPAMLTPGEFVMNRASVSKYGVGFMKSLNKGQIPGFNKGGLVGGGVQYRDNGGKINNASGGGMFSIDTSRIRAVFDNAIAGFSGIFDNIVKNFSGVQNALTQLVTGMSNMTMQHTVTVEGLISVGGLNLESIKQELSTSIGQMVSQEVKRVIDENNKKFNAG